MTDRRMLTVAALAVLAVPACTSPPPPPEATTVEVSRGRCGTGWSAPHGGDQTIQVRNVGTVTMEVELVDPATHGIYAEIESLAPGTIRPIRLVLARGTYAFSCLPEDSDEETGPAVAVQDGPATGATAITPVDETMLAPAVKTYRAHVTTGLAGLAADVTSLRAALASGDRAASRRAWLAAQLAYNRLGAAYGTFGDAADAIDGLPDGHPGGVRDKHFTGLRRIEYGLWHDEPLPALTALAARLASDVAALRAGFGRERTDPNDLPLRAHEILENTLRFELTGAADQGGGAGLAVLAANIDGTRMVLDAIAPVIQPRYPGWAGAVAELTALRTRVAGFDHGGSWPPVEALSTADREKLDGELGQVLEDLAPIATIGEVRRTQ